MQINQTMSPLTDTVQNEFWFHVANQDEIPIFGIVDKSLNMNLLLKILPALPKENQSDYINNLIQENPDVIDIFRTFIGVSDKRMYLDLSYIFAKTKYKIRSNVNILGESLYNLDKHDLTYFKNLVLNKGNQNQKLANKSVKIISNYLLEKQLLDILLVLQKLSKTELETLIDKLILPKEIQQAEAKRRGHGAEHSVAVLLGELGISFIPKDKHINPMSSKDPNVDIKTFAIVPKQKDKTYSFDLIIETHQQQPLAFLQALIHTSDPGQFGVNKSKETKDVKRDLTEYNQKNTLQKELWGLVDGVGFSENKTNTIDKMLAEFDYFFQLKTLYKVGLKLHKLDLVKIRAIRFDMTFYSKAEAVAMFKKYGSPDMQPIIDNFIPANTKEIIAGKAWLYL